jgi:hypothetical protein
MLLYGVLVIGDRVRVLRRRVTMRGNRVIVGWKMFLQQSKGRGPACFAHAIERRILG